MPRRRGALLAWGSAVALVLVLGACKGGGGDEGPPVPGGTLKVSVRDLGSLDPAATTGRGGLLAIAQLFDSLTAIDPATAEAVPAAASKWSMSADGLTWTFELVSQTFHDGTPVTANDFKAAFDRVARKSTNSDVAFQLESVRGFQAAKIAGSAQGLDGIRPTAVRKLNIVLERPFAELPLYLAHPALAPLPKTMIAKPALLQQQPVGNGPFKMSGPRTGERVGLDRYEGHEGGTAYLDHLQIDLVNDPNQAWRDFLRGRNDVAEVPAEALSGSGARRGQGGFTPFWAALYYGPNLRSPKYAKPEVRRAISLAINRKQIADSVYGGTKETATGIIPRGVGGYQPQSCADCVRDQERARTLINAAFGGKPPEMIIDHLDASPSREVATAIANDLKEVGLNVALRAHDSTEYLKLLEAGRHEIAELGWLSEVPSPDGFLAQQLRTGSPNNHTGFADRSFDTLIDQARATRDDAARLTAYRKAEMRAFEIMPLIPIVFFRNHVGVAERVHRLHIDGAGLFDAARVWVSES
jgi:ABC-type oligopeptide transport system substrate-binding subunit